MGAKNCPETPRQKMINMMYIVLTAMLALNVAAEVLEAFKLVDSSLNHTLDGVDTKNRQVYMAFEQAYIENPAKVKQWKQTADEVKAISDSMNTYIEHLKEALVRYSGSKPINEDNPYDPERFNYFTPKGDTLEIKKEDDLNGTSEYMITQKNAKALKKKITDYKNALADKIDDESLKSTILEMLETPDPQPRKKDSDDQKTWESQYFENKPLIAVITVLSKMQIDVRNSEANAINYLYSQIDAGSFKFNRLGARVIAKSNLVFRGEPYEAEVFLAAEDTTQQPEIIINGKPAEVKDGKAIYRTTTNSPGVFKWSGLIKYKTPSGAVRDYPFTQEYQVTVPSVTMSATKMNVLYRGLDNPFDINGGGIPKENLVVEMTNGSVIQKGDGFVIRPDALDEQGKRTKISVYANISGSRRLLGTSEWRVKSVPPPVAQIAGRSGGTIRKEVLAIQDGILAVMEDFDFDYHYKVTQFNMQFTGSGGYTDIKPSRSNRFTPEQKTQMGRLQPNSVIYIDNIKVVGDNGETRNLDPISFKIQ
ncbi:MAG: hypothetical protein CSA36_08030 [Draconibacterium sp.]|nr:MAG: hypothetical protein CSA36_08030 [Draconibacterium sp.]